MSCETYKGKAPVLHIRGDVMELRRGSKAQVAEVYGMAGKFKSGEARFSCKKVGGGKFRCCTTYSGLTQGGRKAIGLGDAIHATLSRLGVHWLLYKAARIPKSKCGCAKRRENLNRIKLKA